jgi:hypothetical protein
MSVEGGAFEKTAATRAQELGGGTGGGNAETVADSGGKRRAVEGNAGGGEPETRATAGTLLKKAGSRRVAGKKFGTKLLVVSVRRCFLCCRRSPARWGRAGTKGRQRRFKGKTRDVFLSRKAKTTHAHRKGGLDRDVVLLVDFCPTDKDREDAFVKSLCRSLCEFRRVCAQGEIEARKRARTQKGKGCGRWAQGGKTMEEDAVLLKLLEEGLFNEHVFAKIRAEDLEHKRAATNEIRDCIRRGVWAEPLTLPHVQLKLETRKTSTGKEHGGSKTIRISAAKCHVIDVRIEGNLREFARDVFEGFLYRHAKIERPKCRTLRGPIPRKNLPKEAAVREEQKLRRGRYSNMKRRQKHSKSGFE